MVTVPELVLIVVEDVVEVVVLDCDESCFTLPDVVPFSERALEGVTESSLIIPDLLDIM